VASLTFNQEPEQYLVAVVLRPGNAPAARGAVGILSRLIERLRQTFPNTILRVRLDGGFASPEVLDFLDEQPDVEYVVNMASNAVLVRRVRQAMRTARRMSRKSGETEHVYGELYYQTKKTWKHKRRVIYKAEVVRHPGRLPKDNPRFVVTNMKQGAKFLYEKVYCQRGDLENRIKLRPEKLLEMIVWQGGPTKPRIPLRVAYEVGAARQRTVRSPRTMYPHSQEWRQNREVTMYLPA